MSTKMKSKMSMLLALLLIAALAAGCTPTEAEAEPDANIDKETETITEPETNEPLVWLDKDIERWQDELSYHSPVIRAGETDDYNMIGQRWAEAYAAQYAENVSEDNPARSSGTAVLSVLMCAESLFNTTKTVVYSMRFAFKPVDAKGFERWFAGWSSPVDAEVYPQYDDWMEFSWSAELRRDSDSWSCIGAGSGGLGGWGYLNYDEAGVFELYLQEAIDGDDSGAENVIRNLPFVDWSEFDTQWDTEGWNALWTLMDAHCLTEGQVYGPEETRMWLDVYPADQYFRNLYIMLTALNTDGAYSEGIATILVKQRNYDPEIFDFCLQQLTADEREIISMFVRSAA